MIIKDIAKQGIPEIGNILPLIKNNIIPIKIYLIHTLELRLFAIGKGSG